jgi:FMN reductase
MSEPRRIAVVSAGLSTPSSTRMLADRLTAAVIAELGERGIPASADTFELRDYAHEITNTMLTGFAAPELESMITAVTSADAVIAVTPIFTTSFSGLFKSFVDILDVAALTGTPVLIGATGGTLRHSLAIDYAIRPLFAYLHADAVSTGVFAASADWGGAADQVAPLPARIRKGAAELADAVARRGTSAGADPYDPATYLNGADSFAQLLGGTPGD